MPFFGSAQELSQDVQTTFRACVLEVLHQEQRTILGTGTPATVQSLKVEILSGERLGEVLTVENDYQPLAAGDKFFLLHTRDGVYKTESYTVSDPYRVPTLAWLFALFVTCTALFGGLQGLRGLLSLLLGLIGIVYILIPAVLAGYSPLLVSIAVASLIVVFGSYITHGITWTTTAAVLGMVVAVLLAGCLASVVVMSAKLTGFESDEAIYLNFGTSGSIDFAGLFLGGIIIGLLGVLYDAAIGQAVAVEELKRAGPHLSSGHIFFRALRIGREHIGALVNTLAIAYVGASLPVLLLVHASGADLGIMINREIFAAEIVRALVGSIGIILAVPITTAIAMYVVRPDGNALPDAHHH